MGRKTNSVSLRLKKTNRDYNHCWYGDILYADTFSKCLKVGYYLSQTLKTIDMPCPQTSVIGAFKKANLLVCYLDPKKRKRLLEKYLKKAEIFSSFRQKNQDSKALLNPLEGGLGTKFSRSLLLFPQFQKYRNVQLLDYALSCTFYRGQSGTDLRYIRGEHKKPGPISAVSAVSHGHVIGISHGSQLQLHGPLAFLSFEKILEEKANILFAKEKQTIVNNYFSCRSNLELSEKLLGLAGVPTKKKPLISDILKKKTHILGTFSSPYIFENSFKTIKVLCKFKHRDHLILRDKNSSFSAFNQNINFFGKQNSLGFSCTSFYCSENLFFKGLGPKTFFIKKENRKHVDKKLFYIEKKSPENSALNILYGFYNGFSHFLENAVCLSFYKSTNETSCALFLADTVSYLLERKVLFRSIKRQLLLELNQPKKTFLLTKEFPKLGISGAFENKKRVTGIRISCSGRVGGRSKKAQRSRKDTFMWGETGLHVFSSKLDFAKTHAETPFGVVGVQVWVSTK